MSESSVTKELTGKTIYLRPTGNLARGKGNDIYTAKVDKVARVFITITLEGQSNSDKLRFNDRDNRLDAGWNSGYVFFTSKEEVKDKVRVENVAKAIANQYQYQRDYCRLNRDTIEKVAELLGIEI
jgi:hypothetical protein